MPVELPQEDPAHACPILWISPVDEYNAPVDPRFLEAANLIGLGFLLYRAAELNDESRARELAEKAVHQASRARTSRPIEDPVAYCSEPSGAWWTRNWSERGAFSLFRMKFLVAGANPVPPKPTWIV
jgi:hypothetical protein